MIGAAVLLIYAGKSIRDGDLTGASVLAFLTMVAMMYDPIRRLNKVNLVLQQSLAAAQRVMDLMAQESRTTSASSRARWRCRSSARQWSTSG